MSKVTVSDGMDALDAGSGSVHSYSSEYTYKDGYYDREEREFYGFREVKELRPDGSTITRKYLNDNYFTKGYEEEVEIRDRGGCTQRQRTPPSDAHPTWCPSRFTTGTATSAGITFSTPKKHGTSRKKNLNR